MKKTKYILAILLSVFVLTSCEEDPDTHVFPKPDVDFSYSIQEGEYTIEYIIGSTIQFENTSVLTGAPRWDMGDGTTSTEASPKHIYGEPGTYEVKLTVDDKTVSKKILISDMKTIVRYASSDSIYSIAEQSVLSFDVELPNPGSYPATFEWIFPEGTTDENGNIVTSSNKLDPGKLKFGHVGSQVLRLNTTVTTPTGVRQLETDVINVHVGYKVQSKTIYLGSKDGTLRALKLIKNLPAGMKNKQFNLPATSGNHAFNLLFNSKDSLLYLLDAGKQIGYIDDSNTKNQGDGVIYAISPDGKKTEIVVTNVGKFAFDDPHFGYYDESNRTIYFSDRNTGIRSVPADTRNEAVSSYSYMVENNRLTYYANKDIGYGAGNANFTKIGDTWWWGKYFISFGIFRFNTSDVYASTAPVAPNPSAGIAMAGVGAIKSFVVDEARSMVYFALVAPTDEAGFFAVPRSNFESAKSVADIRSYRKALLPVDAEGGTSEPIYISQIALDSDDGCVYFGYRAGEGATESTGLKRYDPTSGKLETLINGLEIYGVAINNTKTYLF